MKRSGRFLSIGHSNRHLHDFTTRVLHSDIRMLCDVRRVPASRHCPWFSGAAVHAAMRAVHVGYTHLDALGGLRPPPTEPRLAASVSALALEWRGFAAYMQSDEFARAFEQLARLGERYGIVGLLCAEHLPQHCHRRLLCDALVLRGLDAFHVLDEGVIEPHRKDALACLDEHGRIQYPALQRSLF